jgi:hypothetical protein
LRVQRVPRLGSAGCRRDLYACVVEQLDDALALDLVVLDDEQAAVAGLSIIRTRSKAFFNSSVVAGLIK